MVDAFAQAEAAPQPIKTPKEMLVAHQKAYRSAWKQGGRGLTAQRFTRFVDEKLGRPVEKPSNISALVTDINTGNLLKAEDQAIATLQQRFAENPHKDRLLTELAREACGIPESTKLPDSVSVDMMAFSFIARVKEYLHSGNPSFPIEGSFMQNALTTTLLEDSPVAAWENIKRLWQTTRVLGKLLFQMEDPTQAKLQERFMANIKGAISAAAAITALRMNPDIEVFLPTTQLDAYRGIDAVIADRKTGKLKGILQVKSKSSDEFTALETFTAHQGDMSREYSPVPIESRNIVHGKIFSVPVYVPGKHSIQNPALGKDQAYHATFNTENGAQWNNIFHTSPRGAIHTNPRIVSETYDGIHGEGILPVDLDTENGTLVVFSTVNWHPVKEISSDHLSQVEHFFRTFSEWKESTQRKNF